MKIRGWLVFAGVVCLAATGCALQTGESSDETGETEVASSTSEPLIGGWASGIFRWDQGQPALSLESTRTHVCVLTQIGGRFAGTGEAVQLTSNNTNWVLTGFSQQSGVSGEAVCFPLSKFTGVGGTRQFSNEGVASVFSRGKAASQSNGGGCQEAQLVFGLGSDFTFFEGMQGEMAGAGEASTLVQAPSQGTGSIVRSRICTAGVRNTFSRFLRINTPGSIPTQFMNADGAIGDLNAVQEFSIGGNRSSDAVVMAPTSQAMCALTRVIGKFAGFGETVQIRPEGDNWVLRTTKGAASDFVGANARCIARHQ